MAHIRQSRPYCGLGFQVKVHKAFQVAPSSLRSGGGGCMPRSRSREREEGERERERESDVLHQRLPNNPKGFRLRHQPVVELRTNPKSTSHRCYLVEVAFAWEFIKETIHLPLGCLQGGLRRAPSGTPASRVGRGGLQKACLLLLLLLLFGSSCAAAPVLSNAEARTTR